MSGEQKAGRLAEAEVDATVTRRIVGLHDSEADEHLEPPYAVGHPWISLGTSRVLLHASEDIYKVRFRFELWDGQPPPADEREWPINEVVDILLPSGVIGIDNFDFTQESVFDVDRPGRYRLRLGWRAAEWDPDGHRAQAFALAQFWD